MKTSIAMIMTALIAAGCTSPVVHGTGDGADTRVPAATLGPIAAGDAVVVLKSGAVLQSDSHVDCVREALADKAAKFRITPEKALREALFPWFEQPVDDAVIADLAAQPLVRDRIAELGLRYLVEVGGESRSDISGVGGGGSGAVGYVGANGVFLCGAGPGGAGCLGFMAWARTSDLFATVWDLREGRRAARLEAQVSGGNVLIGFILPVPLIAPTETAACIALADHVANFITTGELPEPPTAAANGDNSAPETDQSQEPR